MLTEHFHNTQKDTGHYSNDLRYVLSLQNTIAAFEEIKTWEGYAKTPLHSLDSMASDIGHHTKGRSKLRHQTKARCEAAKGQCVTQFSNG